MGRTIGSEGSRVDDSITSLLTGSVRVIGGQRKRVVFQDYHLPRRRKD